MQPIFEDKKAELIYQNVGEEKARTQIIANITEDATGENIVAFGQLMGQLAPEQEAIKSIVTIEKNRYNI